jgi:ABC-type multidrug transport system fused ATPase/permease subunit
VSLTVFIYGGYLVIKGQTSLGTVFAMQSLFGLVFQPAGQLVRVVGDVQKALGAADRVYEYLNEEPGVPEYEDAVELVGLNGDVTFVDVSFSYLSGVAVLSDISFSARSGETIALVGPSGAGKSTLASLIPRFHDPDNGAVLLDGTDLRDLTLDSLRQQIGIVFQDTYLFAASIRDNIAFGYEGATEDEIVRAAAAANVLEFVERLPAGFDTWVGERGVQLSEGQKQRIAIARALLREPRILILDEPTAALDARSESLLQAALDDATRGRTTFVIAHRLATVLRADLILVLDGGRIVQQGTHHALMAAGGLYRDLYDLQFRPSVEPSDSDSARTGVLAVTPGG